MRCIAVVYRGPLVPNLDLRRLRAIFLGAMDATGADTSDRASGVLNPGNDGGDAFCFIVHGPDALLCRGSARYRLTERPEQAGDNDEMRALLREEHGVLWVEESPMGEEEDAGLVERRLALAVASLLTDDVVAILDPAENRLAPVTCETTELLRSPSPSDAFASAVLIDGERLAMLYPVSALESVPEPGPVVHVPTREDLLAWVESAVRADVAGDTVIAHLTAHGFDFDEAARVLNHARQGRAADVWLRERETAIEMERENRPAFWPLVTGVIQLAAGIIAWLAWRRLDRSSGAYFVPYGVLIFGVLCTAIGVRHVMWRHRR